MTITQITISKRLFPNMNACITSANSLASLVGSYIQNVNLKFNRKFNLRLNLKLNLKLYLKSNVNQLSPLYNQAKKIVGGRLGVHALIRPRGGDFNYSEAGQYHGPSVNDVTKTALKKSCSAFEKHY